MIMIFFIFGASHPHFDDRLWREINYLSTNVPLITLRTYFISRNAPNSEKILSHAFSIVTHSSPLCVIGVDNLNFVLNIRFESLNFCFRLFFFCVSFTRTRALLFLSCRMRLIMTHVGIDLWFLILFELILTFKVSNLFIFVSITLHRDLI